MRWIDDVRASLDGLDASHRALRRFGLLTGAVLAAVGLLLLRRHPVPRDVLAVLGALLALGGALAPRALRPVHRAWMALAFALGWVVSRLVLTAVFVLAVTPLALAARLAGKRFLDLGPEPGASTYWVRRPPGRAARHEKMY